MSATQIDTIERTDTSAADQAWLSRDIPCAGEACPVAAVWHARKPCSHSSVWCDGHRRWHIDGMARALFVYCCVCDTPFDRNDITWTRL